MALACFNTVNGRYCCLIDFVLPSLRSGTWDVRTSSSLCSSAVSHPSAHTVNGRYCCFIIFVLPSLRSGTCDVWTSPSLCSSAVSHSAPHTASGRYYCNVRMKSAIEWLQQINSFNTASGRCCCNPSYDGACIRHLIVVSIPQAAGVVA